MPGPWRSTNIQHVIDMIEGKAQPGQKRSPQWRECSRDFLAEHPECECCGGIVHLQAHHVIPFQIAPDLELKFDNLITLCTAKRYGINCHQFTGHLGNFRKWNPGCRADAVWIRAKLRA